jgi:hypothetical protein
MTLVVAHRTPYGVRFCSDMRVIRHDEVRQQGFLGATLKVAILRPRLCIAFAGDIADAIDSIRKVDAESDSEGGDLDDVARLLLEAHLESRRGVSFIVAGLHPTTLTRIRDGRAERDLQSAWVGDLDAFELFQASYLDRGAVPYEFRDALEGEVTPEMASEFRAIRAEQFSHYADLFPDQPGFGEDIDIADRSHRAMRDVLASSLATVGEAAIFIAPQPPLEPEYFGYLEESSAFVEQGLNHPEAGSPALGGFSFAILTPREPGIAAVGVYFLQGRLGLLHHPLKCDSPRPYRDVSVKKFKDAVRQEFAFSLVGIGLGASE